jgi:hypothetical protein
MKTRLIVIVAIGLLAVAASVCGGRSAMKGGRLHHWLVVHNLHKTGVYKGEKIRAWHQAFMPNDTFFTTEKIYRISAEGTITQCWGDSPYLPMPGGDIERISSIFDIHLIYPKDYTGPRLWEPPSSREAHPATDADYHRSNLGPP